MTLIYRHSSSLSCDEINLASDEEAPLSVQMDNLMSLQRRFFSAYDPNTSETSLKLHDFGLLVKENPFSQMPRQQSSLTVHILTVEPSQTKISDISTCYSRKDEPSLERGSISQDSKSVRFSDCTGTPNHQNSLPGILKCGKRCRFPRSELDYQKEVAKKNEEGIPRWGRDWEALENRILRKRSKVPKETFDEHKIEAANICTEESETYEEAPASKPKSKGFFKSQALKLKRLVFVRKNTGK